MRKAAIDIGTNTVLLLIADVQDRQIQKVLYDEIKFARLGEKVHQNRFFLPEAMSRAYDCLKHFKTICDQLKVDEIIAVATSASRDSKNAPEFYQKIKNELAIEVKIIAGTVEAELSFLGGILPFQNKAQTAILDIGGGSTEFVTWSNLNNHLNGQSLDMGCVRATELFLEGDPYHPESVKKLEHHLNQIWSELGSELQVELKSKEWTAIAGTPTTLAAIILNLNSFHAEQLDGYRLSRQTVAEWFSKLSQQTQTTRAAYPLVGAGRADILVAGVAILLTAMNYFNKESVVVSSRGLRHGIMLS